MLDGEPVEAVHAALPPIADAAGRTVTAKMLRAALSPARVGRADHRRRRVTAGRDRRAAGRADLPPARRAVRGAQAGPPGRRGRYPFGPLLRCAKCGNQLTGERGPRPQARHAWAEPEPRDYYACANPHKALGVTRPCRGVSVPADDVHALIRDAVEAWAQTPAARLAAAARPPRPPPAGPSWRPGSPRRRTGWPT